MIEAAHPTYPHFLVWMFAVSPARQRRGFGRLLMGQALAWADREVAPAYLWTGNPDNLPYYRSHGFEVLREADVSGATNWFMERAPRTEGTVIPDDPEGGRLWPSAGVGT